MLTEYEYLFLKNRWVDTKGVAYNVVGGDLYEAGCIDDFGFVTPKGEEAIKKYEGITYALSV